MTRQRIQTAGAQSVGFVSRFLPLWLAAGVASLLLTTGTFAYGAHLENNDHFCASCHTEPETTYVARTQHPAVDLASAHTGNNVKCIDCHSGAGLSGRLDAMALGTRDLGVYVGGHYPQPAVQTRPIPDANCLKCHQDVLRKNTFDNHFHVLLPRWQAVAPQASAACVDCHTSHTTDGERQIAWLNKPRTVAQCNACHRIAGD